ALSFSVSALITVSGSPMPELFRTSVFCVFVAPSINRLLTVIEPGKSTGVVALMETVFEPGLAINTVWELFGSIPSDQFAEAQLPLAELVQEFTGPELDDNAFGITSPSERISAAYVPAGNPPGLLNCTWLSCCAVRPRLLVPKVTCCAPPPESEPFQPWIVNTPSPAQAALLLSANCTTVEALARFNTELPLDTCNCPN